MLQLFSLFYDVVHFVKLNILSGWNVHRDLICCFFLSTFTVSTTKKLGWKCLAVFFAGITKVFLTTINILIHKRKFVTTRCADSNTTISTFSDWIMMLLCTGDSRLWVNCKTLEKMVIMILQLSELQGHFMLTILNFKSRRKYNQWFEWVLLLCFS